MNAGYKATLLDNFCVKQSGCGNCPLYSCDVASVREECDFEACSDSDLDKLLIIAGLSATKNDNPYWNRITKIADRQRFKGLTEYGRGVEDDTADINVRLDRIEEELIDALMYLEHLRDGVNKIKEVVG